MRYIGLTDGKIAVVSDTPFINEGMTLLKVENDSLSYAEILSDLKIRDGAIVDTQDPKSLRIALVGNWKSPCGISTYSENLWPEVAKLVGDVRIFAEENETPTSDLLQLGDMTLEPHQVVTCWKRGKSAEGLVAAIKAYAPDIVWIQHEFGLWPNARHWLSLLTQLSGYRVVATQHSVFPNHPDKVICEAPIPEIVVHLEGARKCLKESKGVLGRVHLIPHGCYPRVAGRFWNRYGSEHTIFQQGFGFRYKGWEQSLRTVALLKDKYPDVFFTGLFSESPQNKLEHHRYYAELMTLVSELGLENHVGLIRGFQTDTVIDAFLRINRVALFPYISHPEHEVFGASGAARLAMSREIPVVTSTVNHFSDLPTVKADGPEAMATEIAKLFDRAEAKKQVEVQNAYIDENSWAITAAKHVDVFCRRSV